MSFLTPHLSNLNIRHSHITTSGRAVFKESKKIKISEKKIIQEWCDRQLHELKFNPSNAVLSYEIE